jgi:hypothetical protein
MLKLIGILNRREDLTLDQFNTHFGTTHRDLALRLVPPGLIHGYVQDQRLDCAIDGLPIVGDGCGEGSIRDVGDLDRLVNSPEYQSGAYPDEANFMSDGARMMLTEESIIEAGPGRFALSDTVKVLLFFRRKTDLQRKDFANWIKLSEPLLLPGSAPLRLSRETAIDDPLVAELQAFDGLEISWWQDLSSFVQAWDKRSLEIAGDWIDIDATCGMLARELIALKPPVAD